MQYFNRLTFSYVLDCAVLCAFAVIGGIFSIVSPKRRAFSLTDPSISFPYGPDTVSVSTVFLATVVAPAAIVTVVCLAVVPHPSGNGTPTSPSLKWRRKLWELFTSLLGLAFAAILGFFLTQSMKNLFGKPRPDFLDRCNPNITLMQQYDVGGFSSEFLEGTSVHVTWEICQSKNGSGVGLSEFDDGFRSFPSGHCTISFAGLVYLSLFLAAKFSVTIPFLAPAPFQEHITQPVIGGLRDSVSQSHQPPRTSPRSQAAAPPIHLFVFVFIPIGAAIYIASTRYTDYKHHGFDVLFSSLEGSLCAWFAFRWYHMPIRRGAGWAWGPRSNDRAFGIGIGVGSYHQSKFQRDRKGTQDLEGNRQHSQGTEGIELTSRETSNSSEGQRSVRNILGNTRH